MCLSKPPHAERRGAAFIRLLPKAAFLENNSNRKDLIMGLFLQLNNVAISYLGFRHLGVLAPHTILHAVTGSFKQSKQDAQMIGDSHLQ